MKLTWINIKLDLKNLLFCKIHHYNFKIKKIKNKMKTELLKNTVFTYFYVILSI